MTEEEFAERVRQPGGFWRPKKPERVQVAPKLTITKRITAEWPDVQAFSGVDRTKTDRVPGFAGGSRAA